MINNFKSPLPAVSIELFTNFNFLFVLFYQKMYT